MSPGEDEVRPLGPNWEEKSLETDNGGTQMAFLFVHVKRETDFPELYLLVGQHPLRPPHLTPPTSQPFKDYVLTVRKTSEFMESWHEVGSSTATPTDDVTSNLENGVSLPTQWFSGLTWCAYDAGWLQLDEGDMVWVRDLDGTKCPEDDVIRFYYISS